MTSIPARRSATPHNKHFLHPQDVVTGDILRQPVPDPLTQMPAAGGTLRGRAALETALSEMNAGACEDAHALAAATGEKRVHGAHAQVDLAADPLAQAEAHYALGVNSLIVGNRRKAMLEYKALKNLDPNLASELLSLIHQEVAEE